MLQTIVDVFQKILEWFGHAVAQFGQNLGLWLIVAIGCFVMAGLCRLARIWLERKG